MIILGGSVVFWGWALLRCRGGTRGLMVYYALMLIALLSAAGYSAIDLYPSSPEGALKELLRTGPMALVPLAMLLMLRSRWIQAPLDQANPTP